MHQGTYKFKKSVAITFFQKFQHYREAHLFSLFDGKLCQIRNVAY